MIERFNTLVDLCVEQMFGGCEVKMRNRRLDAGVYGLPEVARVLDLPVAVADQHEVFLHPLGKQDDGCLESEIQLKRSKDFFGCLWNRRPALRWMLHIMTRIVVRVRIWDTFLFLFAIDIWVWEVLLPRELWVEDTILHLSF